MPRPEQTPLDDKDEFEGSYRDFMVAFGLAANHEFRRQADLLLEQKVKELLLDDKDEFQKKTIWPFLQRTGKTSWTGVKVFFDLLRKTEAGKGSSGLSGKEGVSGEGEAKGNSRKGQRRGRQAPLLQNTVPHLSTLAVQPATHQRSTVPVSYSHLDVLIREHLLF